MRLALLAVIAAAVPPGSALAQEQTGTSTSAQTTAPNISIPAMQSATCGAAPSVAQINHLIPAMRRMFPQPGGAFNAGLTAEIRQPCPRNRAAAYLVRTIAGSSWAFASPYPPRPASSLMGAIPCGPAASSADLNKVIGKLRPLFADPAPFNAAIGSIGKQPCVAGRATLYLFALMTDNGMTLKR